MVRVRKIRVCPECGQRTQPSGFKTHLRLAHGIVEPEASRIWDQATEVEVTDWMEWFEERAKVAARIEQVSQAIQSDPGAAAQERLARAATAYRERLEELDAAPLD